MIGGSIEQTTTEERESNCRMKVFDAHLNVSAVTRTTDPSLSGALLFGAQEASEQRHLLEVSASGKLWRHAAQLNALIGPGDRRFPKNAADLIDLRLGSTELLLAVNESPHAWFPLLNASRWIRIDLPSNAAPVTGLRRLARSFPNVRFLVDPFQHGPTAAWMAQARTAEMENIWLTTLGLFPGTAASWQSHEEINEAFHFTTGEVGAGKLLFASGLAFGSAPGTDPTRWLEECRSLDSAQVELIAERNALDLFR
jgi:hypothetical protein